MHPYKTHGSDRHGLVARCYPWNSHDLNYCLLFYAYKNLRTFKMHTALGPIGSDKDKPIIPAILVLAMLERRALTGESIIISKNAGNRAKWPFVTPRFARGLLTHTTKPISHHAAASVVACGTKQQTAQ